MKSPTTAGTGPAPVSITLTTGLKEKVIKAPAGTRLIDALRGLQETVLFTACGGRGICKKCLVNIAGQGLTLACAYVLDHDIEVTIPRGAAAALILEYGFAGARRVACDSGIEASQEEGGVTVRYDGAVIAKGEKNAVYGAAVDIGTTTVVVYVDDLGAGEGVAVESFVNPQAAMGGDVISRIHFVMEHETGLARLQRSIVTAINMAIQKACAAGTFGPGEIYKLTVVGNPTMLHLLLGVDPSSIARAPYAPVFTEAKTLRASVLGLAINPGAVVTALPSIAGYVGADIVAGIALTPMTEEKTFSLYLDIGTNGEMALGNRDALVCCASAAGPAFEGARIRCGVGGVEGAIRSYENGSYSTIGGQPPIGICGSGILDIVAWYLDKGIIAENGCMESDVCIEHSENTGCGSDIVVTPADVREVQLAKAAIASGIKILIKESGITTGEIERVYLAGAFGNYMNVSSAARIGMVPHELASRVVCIGNAAGAGARLALRSREYERSLGKIIDMAEYVELSGRPDFNDMFVAEMKFGTGD